MHSTICGDIEFFQTGLYHIKVLGNVRPELWDYFDGETHEVITDPPGQVTTSMILHVRDQAELTGLLTMLYNWGLVLLSVKKDGFEDSKRISECQPKSKNQ